MHRLDFTTGKQVDRGQVLRVHEAVALANKLERTRRVRGISQVTPLGWLQSRLKMGNKSPSPTVYITDCEIQVQTDTTGQTSHKETNESEDESQSRNNKSAD